VTKPRRKRTYLPESAYGAGIMAWLTELGWDCYPEVALGGIRADLVAKKGSILWTVEVKVNASLHLLEQALRWQSQSNLISIATPRRPDMFFAKICEDYGVGVFSVVLLNDQDGKHAFTVNEHNRPRLRRTRGDRLLNALHHDQKKYAPGSTAISGYSSPWRRTMDEAVHFIGRHPGCTLKELVSGIKHHYSTATSAIGSLRFWLDRDDRVLVQREGKSVTYTIHNKVSRGPGENRSRSGVTGGKR